MLLLRNLDAVETDIAQKYLEEIIQLQREDGGFPARAF